MLLEKIKLTNLLSFGPDGMELELRPLNVLIGPNGSGKSNLIEAISLLQAAPTELEKPIREGGGIQDWIWKGKPDSAAQIAVKTDWLPGRNLCVKHTMMIAPLGVGVSVPNESIESRDHKSPLIPVYKNESYAAKAKKTSPGEGRVWEDLQTEPDESILSQLKSRANYPEITLLGRAYRKIRQYREWSFGRQASLRQPQKADQPNEYLEPDCVNLGLVLNRLRGDPAAKQNILEKLKNLYEGIEDYDVSVVGGTVQVFFHESGMKVKIPATRLSDGTLRYLCLLAILCDPNPPPLVCIEEPELGLHPDIIPTLAKLLKEASERTQLIVTTHSDLLVDAFNDEPETIVVCDKEKNGTTMKRLDAKELEVWLKKYRLGELWIKGEIGGVRW